MNNRKKPQNRISTSIKPPYPSSHDECEFGFGAKRNICTREVSPIKRQILSFIMAAYVSRSTAAIIAKIFVQSLETQAILLLLQAEHFAEHLREYTAGVVWA